MNPAELWEQLRAFLVRYDVSAIAEWLQGLDWQQILRRPLFWMVTLPLLGWIVWKRYLRVLTLIVSCFLFVALVQTTLPPSGGSIPLDRLLLFVGGCVVLIGLNFYILFIRGD